MEARLTAPFAPPMHRTVTGRGSDLWVFTMAAGSGGDRSQVMPSQPVYSEGMASFRARVISRLRGDQTLSAQLREVEDRLAVLVDVCYAQNHLVHEIHRVLTESGLSGVSDSLDGLGVAHAESVVYLNRSIDRLRDDLGLARAATDQLIPRALT
jgi:hypothetical protein